MTKKAGVVVPIGTILGAAAGMTQPSVREVDAGLGRTATLPGPPEPMPMADAVQLVEQRVAEGLLVLARRDAAADIDPKVDVIWKLHEGVAIFMVDLPDPAH